MTLVAVALAADLEPLVEALGESVVRCEGQLPEGQAPLLVDLRSDCGDLLEQLARAPRPLVVVAEAGQLDRLSALPELCPWVLLLPETPVTIARAVVEAKIASWQQRAQALDEEMVEQERRVVEIDRRLEDQSIELLIRNSERSRLDAFKKGVLSRLGDADRGFISDILRQVNELEKQEDLPGPVKSIQNNLHHTALKIQHIFRSFDYWEKSDRALDGRTVLVVSEDRKLRALMVRAFSSTEGTVQGFSSWKEGIEFLKDARVDIIYVDWANSELIAQAQEHQPDVKCVLLTSELLFEGFGAKMLELPLQNVLITSQTTLAENDEDALFLRELTATAGKLITEDIFGLEKYLDWGTKVHEVLVTNSDQRFEILEQIQQFAPQAGLRRSMAQNLETVADELLMNAIWDAPVDETGHHKYASLSRRKSVQLLPHECPVLRYAADSRWVALSVTDPFGGLERDHAYRYLVKCFSRRDDQIDSKRGGAGLGLYTAFLAMSTFVINVAPGFRTEVIGLLDNRLSRRKMSGRSRTYHYFLSKGRPRVKQA